MKNWTPKIGDRVGVEYHSADFSRKLASIETVERVSPTGIQVTLSNGRKYKNTRGDFYYELTHSDPSRICSIEEAEELIAQQTARQQQDEEAKAIYQQSPKAQRQRISNLAANDAIARIADEGYGVDSEGRIDVLHDEIQKIVERYLENKLLD